MESPCSHFAVLGNMNEFVHIHKEKFDGNRNRKGKKMRGKHRRIISTLLIALLLNAQLSTAAWAGSIVQMDHILSGKEDGGRKVGDATPSDADRVEEEPNTEKIIMQWEFVDDDNLSEGQLSLIGVSQENRADFDTVVSMLPGKMQMVIDGEI